MNLKGGPGKSNTLLPGGMSLDWSMSPSESQFSQPYIWDGASSLIDYRGKPVRHLIKILWYLARPLHKLSSFTFSFYSLWLSTFHSVVCVNSLHANFHLLSKEPGRLWREAPSFISNDNLYSSRLGHWKSEKGNC